MSTRDSATATLEEAVRWASGPRELAGWLHRFAPRHVVADLLARDRCRLSRLDLGVRRRVLRFCGDADRRAAACAHSRLLSARDDPSPPTPSLVLRRFDPGGQVFANSLVLVIGDDRFGKSHAAESLAIALGSKRLAIVTRRPKRWRHLEHSPCNSGFGRDRRSAVADDDEVRNDGRDGKVRDSSNDGGTAGSETEKVDSTFGDDERPRSGDAGGRDEEGDENDGTERDGIDENENETGGNAVQIQGRDGADDESRIDARSASAAILPADLCNSVESTRSVAAADCFVIDRLDGLQSGERLLTSLVGVRLPMSKRPRLEIVTACYPHLVRLAVRSQADFVLIGRVSSLDTREKLRRQWGRCMKSARWNELLNAAVPAASKGVVIDAASRRPQARFLVLATDDANDRFYWYSVPLPMSGDDEVSTESATPPPPSPPPKPLPPVRRNPLAPSRRTRFDPQHPKVAPLSAPPLSRLPRAIVGGIALLLAPRCAMRLYATNRAAHNDASRDYLPRAPTHLGYEHRPGGIALRVEFAAPT